MKRSLWLITVLAGALGCGSSDNGVTDDKDPSTGGTSGKGGVMKADGGIKKPTGPSQPADHPNTHVDRFGNPIGDAGSDPGDDTCEKLQLPANPNSPEILIVLDRSGSMVGLGGGANRWMPSVMAIKQLTSSLTETVAFGLLTFPAPTPPGMMGGGITIPGIGTFPGGGGGGASSCLPGKLQVPVDVNNADQIASVLDMSTPDFGATPTADSLAVAKDALDTGTCGDCPEKPKYVLLVTDGQPNCGDNGTMTTQADVDAVNAVIDELTAAKITTYVIGYDTANDAATAAIMDSFAMHGGTEHQYPVENQQTLVDELTRIAGSLVPCSFDLTSVPDDPTFVRVEIDGKTYLYGTDWTLDGSKIVLDPMGGACPKLRDAKVHDLRITRECTPVQVL